MKGTQMKTFMFITVAALFSLALFTLPSLSSDTASGADKASVTFAKDIAPILQMRCEECHRQGGIAPMSLVTYEETRPWARSIREKVIKREMPPFHATGQVGRYVNDPRLTDSEVAAVTKWVDSGAPKGNVKDLPAPHTWKNEWAHGEPDLVVKVQHPYTLKPSAKDQYVFFFFDYVFPEGTAVRIPKGMRLGIQIHYAPSDQERVDQTSVGIYFADELVKKNLRVLFGDRKDVDIPPGDANYSLVAKKTFDTDGVIRFFHVHMHLRGKSYVMRFTYPDGRVETALEVPRYDFNWQRVYTLVEPMRVPKGTSVEFIGTYDNSIANKFNPDPTKVVHWGEKTTDEMMQGRIFWEAADENLNLTVKKGHVVPSGDSARKSQ